MDPTALAAMLASVGTVVGYGALTQGSPLPGTPPPPVPAPRQTKPALPEPRPAPPPPVPAPEAESPEYTDQPSGPPPDWKTVIDNVFLQLTPDNKAAVSILATEALHTVVSFPRDLDVVIRRNQIAPSAFYEELSQVTPSDRAGSQSWLPSLDSFMSLYHDALVQAGFLQPFVSSADVFKRQACQKRLAREGIDTRNQFRRWAARNHPDKGGDAQQFQEINECIDIVFPKGGKRTRKNTFRRRRGITTKKHVRRTRRS